MHFSKAFVISLLVAAASAKTIRLNIEVEDSAPAPGPAPVPSVCTPYVDEGSCMADDCCNWCASPFNMTAGFCMQTMPYPMPGLQCQRAPVACKTLKTDAACGADDDCAWIPMGMPGSGKGMCVQNWDKCKTPKSSDAIELLIKEAKPQKTKKTGPKPIPAPGPKPSPMPTCNATTAKACNVDDCCHWCATPFNLTAGFCMPVMSMPIPFLQCSKPADECDAHTSMTACGKASVCKWIPFGPPTAKGPGMCVFDATACKPKPEVKEARILIA
mmetsp:Transcript_22686/g.35502  ORF Transcript_22686/g.35502 Transcript_22686/m.35502 type:complete len:272 (-) Transcript_22686:122-937(-)|eukprot:CAMPEP_0184295030 /NCGR_PEP_ID=MMETSP1049-20130417/6032_1 /TAXON_ID=77928 /ORGANISM="Proteomonas sulcata, Strain CCMP704" /LENGTH=271 /DNA_ID=CAMNT_0026603461 /DNA_START=124 /DNA_END=939 /DNA_ORIENTATION=-